MVALMRFHSKLGLQGSNTSNYRWVLSLMSNMSDLGLLSLLRDNLWSSINQILIKRSDNVILQRFILMVCIILLLLIFLFI